MPVVGVVAVKTAVAGAGLLFAGIVARHQQKKLEQQLIPRPAVSHAPELLCKSCQGFGHPKGLGVAVASLQWFPQRVQVFESFAMEVIE